MAGYSSEPGALRIDHPLQDNFGIDETRVNHEPATNSQVGVQQGRPEAVVEGQNRHHAVIVGKLEVFHDGIGVGDDIAVGDHHATRLAG